MGMHKFFGGSTDSRQSSSSTSSRPRGHDPAQFNSESTKLDYAFGLNQSTSPISTDPSPFAHGYNHSSGDAPPPYSRKPEPQYSPTDSKMFGPDKPNMFDFSDPMDSSSSGEDPLAALAKYDIVVILDDSHSMKDRDHPGGRTRWEQAWDALEILVESGIRYDKDGITIYPLNNLKNGKTVMSRDQVVELRKKTPPPQRGTHTPTGSALDELLSMYKRTAARAQLGSPDLKKRIFLVITDGAATDEPKDPIVSAARFFQDNGFPLDQVGIQFVQVGSDKKAGEWLEQLDKGLKGEMGTDGRDIVDTIKSNGQDLRGDALVKALTGGINRKQDRIGEK